jgi:pyruvate/2-oxoglutarate dehydrogenase complex dihydrolipoamide acyltransferase (E2) component
VHGRGDEDGEHPARRTAGVVKKINAEVGDSLAVDDVIMEFE